MRIALLAVTLSMFACRSAPPPRSADTLIFNGRIYLGSPEWTTVEALLVADGRVIATGASADLASRAGNDVVRIDLGGATAVPGLQDAHGHLEGLGAALEIVDLRGAASYEDVVARVVARAASTPRGAWIYGRGWDQNLWPIKEFPTHAALSRAVPDHPVLLSRVDGHASLANAVAMRAAGLDRAFDTEFVVSGGRVLLDNERRPTGVFVDAAERLFDDVLPTADSALRERHILAAQEKLLSVGLTAVHDMGVSREGAQVLRRLRDSGRLKLRLVEYLSGDPAMELNDLQGFPWDADERDQLSVIGVKLYADGALGSRGATLIAPYHDEPSHSGLALATREQLARCVALCAAKGLQPAVHAIGDAANRDVLDVYEAQMRATPSFGALRPRIEHAQVVSPEDWPRFDALGVIASMQPTHATSDMPWAPDRLGPTRVEGAYAWRRLSADPARLAFGSDFPVEDANPLEGLYAAITCSDKSGRPAEGYRPDQRLSSREALAAFTIGAARAARQEDRRGGLWPGFGADLTVLDVDPLTCEPSALLGARVRMTIVNGEVVYSAR